jgi:hypothetical protein
MEESRFRKTSRNDDCVLPFKSTIGPRLWASALKHSQQGNIRKKGVDLPPQGMTCHVLEKSLYLICMLKIPIF